MCVHKIIPEIGAVLLNVFTGDIEDRFHHYVQPTLFPKLNNLTIYSTGIMQYMINGVESFASVFSEFQQWIKTIQNEKDLYFAIPTEISAPVNGPNVSFCSWSGDDFEFFIEIECKRANIEVPSDFKVWIDGRKCYKVSLEYLFVIPLKMVKHFIFFYLLRRNIRISRGIWIVL